MEPRPASLELQERKAALKVTDLPSPLPNLPPTSSRRRRRGNLVKATVCSQAGKAWRPGQANTFVKNKKESKREEEIQRGNSRELFSLFNCYILLLFLP